MATLQERLNRMKAAGAVQNAVLGGGTAQAATPPSSAVSEGATLTERLNRMKADGQAAQAAVKTPVMLPTAKKPVPTPLPTINPAAVLASKPSPATGRALLTGPVLLPTTTSGRIRTLEGRAEVLEKNIGEMRSRESAPAVGSTSYGRGSDPALSTPSAAIGSTNYGAGSAPQIAQNKALTGAEKELRQTRRNLALLQRAKEGEDWEKLRQEPDFEALSKGAIDPMRLVSSYPGMTEEELQLYNYLIQRDIRDGTEENKAYGQWLGETLAQRKGEEDAKKLRETENPFLRTAATGAYGIGAGLDQFARGFERGVFGDLADGTTSAVQYGSQRVREDLAEAGPKVLGSSLGQIGYDVASTTANMLPSVAMGVIHPAAGAATIGLSAGGSAYDEAIREGYSKDQAKAYAVLSGASEAGLQYALGGISKLGNNVIAKTAMGKQVSASIQNIRSASLRVAAQLGTSMLSEASEEYLQEILEPVFRNLALGEDNEVHLVTEEAAYAALLAVITTGALEGPGIVRSNRQISAQTRQQLMEQGGQHVPMETVQNMEARVAEITGATQGAGDVQAQKTAPAEGAAVKADSDVYTVVSKLSESIPALSDMKPVSTVSTKTIQPKSGKTMADRARGFFEGIKGTVTRAGFGDVIIDTRSVKDDLSHGIGAAKAAVIPTIPHVIREGRQIDFKENWKGRGYDGYVFAAPVMMDGKPVYIAAVVKQSSKNRFYLHEVVDSNGNIIKIDSGDGATQTSLAAESDAGTPSPLSSDPIIPSPGDGVNTEYAPPCGEVSAPADGDWQSLAQQADDLFPMPPERTKEEMDGLLEQAEAMYGQKGDPSRGEAFIPTERERGIVDDRTPAEKAMVEEAQRRKAAQPVSTEPTYRMTPAMEKLGMEAPSRPITDAGASESLRENSRALYEAKKQLDKVLRDTHADERARRVAKGIVDGIYTFEDAKKMGLNEKAMVDIASAMQLVRSYNAKGIKAHQERTNWAFDSEVRRLINGSDTWTPPSVRSLNFNTMQRNVERMMDRATAKAINAELFDPVLENEAKRIRFCNNQLDRVRGFNLTTQESAMVQRVMEGKIAEVEIWGLGLRVETIYKAADTITQMYADFYDAINDFLVAHGYEEIGWQRNYAPHQQMENLTKLQRYLQRLGFSVEVTELPTEIAGRTDAFKPGKMFDPFFQHRAGGEGDIKYDAVGGLESYINYMSNVLYHTDDIQKLRRFNEGLRSKYAEGELRTELDRLNDLQDRIISGDTEGIQWDDIQAQKDRLYEELDKKSKLGGFVSVLDDYTNVLAGKQTKLDRAVESMFGRKALNLGRNIQNAFARSAVMGNLSSAINQTVQLPQLTAEVGPKYVLQAIGDVAGGKLGDFNQQSTFLTGKQGVKTVSALEGMEILYDKLSVPFELVDDLASRIIVRSKYLQQVAQGADHATALEAADQYANRLVGSRMKGAKPIVFEQKNPITKLVTTFQLEVANGWEHIVHDLPMEIQETARTKGKAAAVGQTVKLLVAGEIAAFLANCLIESITGREPVPFDGIGMAANYMASGYGMTKEDYIKSLFTGEETPEEFDVPAAMSEAAGGVMDNIPYASNVTTLLGMTDGRLPLPQIETKKLGGAVKDAWTAATSEDEEERKAAAPRILPQLGAGGGGTLLSFAPAGNQIKKSAKGIWLLGPGGAYIGYGDDKRLKYPVEQSAGNWAKGVMFGPSALPETDAYYAEGKKILTANETQLYESMVEGGSDGQKVYDVMQSLREAKERTAKVDVLLGYEGSRKEKEALFSGMVTETMDDALDGLAELGVPIETVLTAYKAQYGLESDKDAKTGKTVSLSLAKNKKAAVDPYLRGLTKKQREAVYEALGISEKVWSLPMGLPIKAGGEKRQ